MRPFLAQGVGLAMGLAHYRRLLAPSDPTPVRNEGDDMVLWYVFMVVFLTLIAGLMSGLTLGLMSLDSVDLEILKRTGTASQQASAAAIMPLLQNPHRLLVTLLLCNSAAAEALPLFLDRLADPITAVVVSVTVVLLFGEIIPQAVCSSHGLEAGAASAPFVHLLMALCSPLAWPIGWILDKVLGKHHTALFKRSQLKALVDIHHEGQVFGGQLSADEVGIIKGALDLTAKTADAAMTPLDMVFMLSSDAVLDADQQTAILASGHSRIPVYRAGNRNHILGITLVKELVQFSGVQDRLVGDLKIRSLPYLLAKTPMYDMLKIFKIGRSHMAILTQPTDAARAARAAAAREHMLMRYDSDSTDTYSEGESLHDDGRNSDLLIEWQLHELEPVGVITIEDVLEELLQFEIVDETDQYVDNLHSMRVNSRMMASALPLHLRRILTSRQALPRIGGASEMGDMASGNGPSGRKRGTLSPVLSSHNLPVLSLSAPSGMLEAMTSGELADVTTPGGPLSPARNDVQLGSSPLQRDTPPAAHAAHRPASTSSGGDSPRGLDGKGLPMGPARQGLWGPVPGPLGARRTTHLKQEVQDQLDLIAPLLRKGTATKKGVTDST